MVAVFIPGLKLTPSAYVPLHQSHAVFPGLIHEVSSIAHGGFRFVTMFDSISRPGSLPIMITRHGDRIGAAVRTTSPLSCSEGESRDTSTCASRVLRCRYMPA